VESVLSDLAMGGSQFDVRMSWTPLSSAAGGSSSSGGGGSGDLSGSSLAVVDGDAACCGEAAGRYRVRPSGLDSIEFLLAAAQGEPLRPLSAVASGRESARIMLALKAAPAFMGGAGAANDDSEAAGSAAAAEAGSGAAEEAARAGSSQILVLDEIDSGIGSRLGQPVGRVLGRMGAPGVGLCVGQILVVGHLPQVGEVEWMRRKLQPVGGYWLGEASWHAAGTLQHLNAMQPSWPRLPARPSVLPNTPLSQVAAHAEHHLCVRKAQGPDERLLTRFDLLAERAERLAEISAMAGLPPAAVEELLAAAGQA